MKMLDPLEVEIMDLDLKPLRDQAAGAVSAMLDVPVVIALGTELPNSFRSGAVGLSDKSLDVAVKPYLDFDGRRAAVIVDDLVLLQNFAPRPFHTAIRGEFLGTVAHEVGHIVREAWIPSPSDPEDIPARVTARVERFASVGLAPDNEARREAWFHHDAPWIRSYLHVSHRLERALRLPCIPSFHPCYGLSSARKYESALGDEPRRLGHIPLAEISGIRPPEAFIELWKSDVRAWFLSIANPTDADIAMLKIGMKMFS
jgi:hypothetical protein